VYAAQYNGIAVAVKQLMVSQFDDLGGTLLEAQTEAGVLGSFFHPNIVRFYGVAYADEQETIKASLAQGESFAGEANLLGKPGTKPGVVSTLQKWSTAVDQCVSANIFIVLEQCKYSLKDVVYGSREKYVLDTASLFNVFEQITAGMAYLHKHEVLHRDLKPGNILVDANNTVKIADFGTAKMGEDRGGSTMASKRDLTAIQHEREMTAFVGTPVFMAPEIMTDEGKTARYGDKADVYSLGMTMWSLWARERPFEDEKHATMSMFTLLKAVSEGARPKFPKDTPPLLAFLIQDCWQVDPHKRPSMEHLLEKLRTYNEHDDDDCNIGDTGRRVSVMGNLMGNLGGLLDFSSSTGDKDGKRKDTRKESAERKTSGGKKQDGGGSWLLGKSRTKLKEQVEELNHNGHGERESPIVMTENPIALHDHENDDMGLSA
jgi:serine/threonine protein kinase